MTRNSEARKRHEASTTPEVGVRYMVGLDGQPPADLIEQRRVACRYEDERTFLWASGRLPDSSAWWVLPPHPTAPPAPADPAPAPPEPVEVTVDEWDFKLDRSNALLWRHSVALPEWMPFRSPVQCCIRAAAKALDELEGVQPADCDDIDFDADATGGDECLTAGGAA